MNQTKNSSPFAGGINRQEFLSRIRGKLPENHQSAGDLIKEVSKTYIPTGRDKALAESFNRFVTMVTSGQSHGEIGKGRAFFITGESGAGKTKIIKNLLATHPVLQPLDTPLGIVNPIITVSLIGPATLANLAKRLLRKAGYPMEARESVLWDELPDVLQTAGVLFVHIDEFQHLFHKGSDHEGLVKYIKGLMNNENWPVSFIISGMPSVKNLLINDAQAERRSHVFSLPPINMTKQRAMVETVIKKLGQKANLDTTQLLTSDMPERIAHAANYQFGRICEVVLAGIHEALLAAEESKEGLRKLERRNFVDAYAEHSDTRGYSGLNPFAIQEFRHLQAGYFILKPTKQVRDDDDE